MTRPNLVAPPPLKHETLSAIRTIILTVDRHAAEINKRWGFNTLPHLVPIEWAERFAAQKYKWELATFECIGSLDATDLDRVRKHGEAMIRAYNAMERVGAENGNHPGPPRQFEFELRDGTPCIVVNDRADLDRVETNGRACQIWSLEEIAAIIEKFPAVSAAKDAFPGAEVIQLRTSAKVRDALNDSLAELPW